MSPVDADSVRPNPEVIKGKKLEDESGNYDRKYETVNSLGDDAVFLGDNYSMCIRASEVAGCKPNCVYYWDNEIEMDITSKYTRQLLSMDNVEDITIRERQYISDGSFKDPRPFWIFLSLPKFVKSGILIAAAAESSSVEQSHASSSPKFIESGILKRKRDDL